MESTRSLAPITAMAWGVKNPLRSLINHLVLHTIVGNSTLKDATVDLQNSVVAASAASSMGTLGQINFYNVG